MACCHTHGITLNNYDGALQNEGEILTFQDFGVEKIRNGTRVKHMNFDPERKVYWAEYG